jgi:non-ribosomal peptide synthetase component F/acyl carrier protein
MGHVANPAFDASTFEIWTALLRGACLVGIEKEALLSPPALAERLASERITVLLLTAALFHQVAREAPGAFGGLRYLLVGGESAEPRAVREILSKAPPETFLHAYGPTEATVYVTLHAAGEASSQRPVLPIGRPIRHVRVHVLDETLRPAPIGVVGDLYAGGDSLARGYRGRPDLTAERFLPDPFSGEAGARLYRTGDRARHLAGGELEFHGRRDGQVKIRGFRIELGEVEAALAELPGVGEAAVLVHDDPVAGRRLVAFVVERKAPAAGGARLRPAGLRAALERKLPSHLVPASCRVLPALPLTPNGKVDRAALQRLAATDSDADGNLFVAPRTPVEEILAGIWTEVLGLDPARRRVGAFDNFFELSGHSLLATQVTFRIREAFGVDLPLERLFDRATLADLAAEIEARIAGERGGQAVRSAPLQPAPRDRPIRASFYQDWMYQYQKSTTESLGIPFAVRVRGSLSLPVLGRGLAEVVRRHEVLRTVFREDDGKVFQVITERTEIPLPLVDVEALPPERREPELRRIGAEDNNLLFDLANGPLVRVRVFRLGAGEHVALFNIHHIVTDGWSLQLFQRELRVLYGAFSQGLPSPLPEPALQFADFSWWQREVFEKESMPAELDWWHRHLAGRPPVLELPADRPRPEEPTAQAVAESLLIGPDLTAALRATARANGCSLAMALIAGLETLLHRYSGGREDLLLDSIFAARHRPELGGMMGFLMNTATLRTDLSGAPTFRELLLRVRASILAAYEHQDVAFPRLLESLFPGQKLYRTLLSRVAFNLISFSEIRDPAGTESIEVPLEVEAIGLADHVAKRDLLFTCLEAQDAVYCDVTGSADLFDPESVVAIAKDYETILKAAAENPDVPIGSLLAVPSYHRATAATAPKSVTTQEEVVTNRP